jgi:hypothetical protein
MYFWLYFSNKHFIMKNILLHCLSFIFLLTSISLHAQTNQYLHFDKVDDYVEVPNASSYIANSNQITFAGWFYHDDLSYGQGLMSIRGGGTGTGEMYMIQLNNGTVECRLITTAGFHEVVAPPFSVVPQVWQHWAWVYDGSTVKLYIDGMEKGSTAASGTITATNKPFTFGKCLLGGFNFVFGGRADEVSMWSKALTTTEIKELMDNGALGTEDGLELYYKINQGVPDGDNTSISQLVSETGSDRNGNLLNFALTGTTSNFGGVLDVSFQAITFPQIPNKLVTDAPFQLGATASSGLPVSYEIISGPAKLNGDMVALDGIPGEVVIKASQGGDGTFDPATDLFNTFQVIDPALNVPFIDARSPLAGDVYVPVLNPIQLAAISNIAFPELFSVTDLKFEINGEEITPTNWGNEHYTAWWTPPSYGSFNVNIKATNNFGATAIKTVSINVVQQATDLNTIAMDQVWADVNNGMVEVEAELPSYQGAFNEIFGQLVIGCPSGGCDEWDRISGIEVKGHNGQWYEIIRYITPYGVACNGSAIDLTDFMSVLQGKITFRVYLGTLGNGFLYSLNLNYTAGIPPNPYSSITELWKETYDFGNPADLQPVPNRNVQFPANTNKAKLKLVSTGHGWGSNNTGNAAEFHDDTHHIWVNGVQTFEQRNWSDCNPNPDGCQPQNGTWFYDRAGWCPGSIAPWFDYDMTPFINQNSATLGYVFDEDYIDMCNANNPNCVSGVTCGDCNDGFNPHLIVASYLISTGDVPLEAGEILGTKDLKNKLAFQVYPNPTNGLLNIELNGPTAKMAVRVYNSLGQLVRVFRDDNFITQLTVDLSGLPRGIYSVEVSTKDGLGVTKVVVE